jgi:uncharacterized protein YprB with RNaseH-like and TPR domain
LQTAIFDIETSSLEAVGAGFIICAVVLPHGEKPIVFRYDKYNDKAGNEVKMLTALLKELDKYDMWVGHNITRFDVNYLKTF